MFICWLKLCHDSLWQCLIFTCAARPKALRHAGRGGGRITPRSKSTETKLQPYYGLSWVLKRGSISPCFHNSPPSPSHTPYPKTLILRYSLSTSARSEDLFVYLNAHFFHFQITSQIYLWEWFRRYMDNKRVNQKQQDTWPYYCLLLIEIKARKFLWNQTGYKYFGPHPPRPSSTSPHPRPHPNETDMLMPC